MRYFFEKDLTVLSAQALRNGDASTAQCVVIYKHVSKQKFRPKYA